jgi:hypothetical protein
MDSEMYLIPVTIEDLGFFCGVTDFLQKGGLARILSPDDENSESKAPEHSSNVLSRCHIV